MPVRLLLFAAIAAASVSAYASASAPAQTHECGATPAEAIAVAEHALAKPSAGGQSEALSCLLAAVRMLDAGRAIVTGPGGHQLLAVPGMAAPTSGESK